jgi:hypothetical protein
MLEKLLYRLDSSDSGLCLLKHYLEYGNGYSDSMGGKVFLIQMKDCINACPNTETVGSNSTGGIDVCYYSVFVLSCV